MKPLSRLILATCLVFSAVLVPLSGDAAAVSSAKQARIRELMRMTGAGKLGLQVLNSMIANMKQALPKVPDEFWKRMVAQTRVDELEELVVPVYDRHFTLAEINQLISFYSTPLGKKVIAEMPEVMQESMSAGQKWGEALGTKIGAQLKKEGYMMN